MVPLASYFLENFELIALSGFQRRPCYQVLQKLFILPSVCRRQVSPLCGICSLALPSLRVRCRLLGDPGGGSSVGAGGGGNLPSLSSPTAASALSVGVLVFKAGEDCCRGLIGSFHVVSGTLG